MSKIHIVTEDDFQNYLQDKLESFFTRALIIFKEYGDNLSWDVTNVLVHAAEKNKVKEVLEILEQHFKKHLMFQHPNARGTIADSFGINPTQDMFLNICKNVLKLQPTQ